MSKTFEFPLQWSKNLLCVGVLTIAALSAFMSVALAHPHIWVTAQLFVQFDDEGQVESLRHLWTFDEGYSSWAVQGLDVNNDGDVSEAELLELAETSVAGLQDYDFFTFAGVGSDDSELINSGRTRMEDGSAGVVLDYELQLTNPADATDGFEVAVFDPEYYVAIDLVPNNPVILINAPETCRYALLDPTPLDPQTETQLLALGPDVTSIPDELKGGLRDAAHRVQITCDGASDALEAQSPAQTESASDQNSGGGTDADTNVANEGGPLFSGPALERGLPVARDGFLGWIFERQQDFYLALRQSLSDFKTDGNAFWSLGILSFLYGVFHAAGPGHGKLVISSYVLATEREVGRGIAMSFVSALLQALVAISFILVAGLVLNLTSRAMSGATNVLVIGSYGLVCLLGLWLVVRQIFGLGHHHHHGDHGDHHHHNHDEGHAHVHAVTPDKVHGSMLETMGVIISVGLRPCSGALIVLVFALSQGVLAAGIAATFLMALGTGITVAFLASFATALKQVVGGAKLGTRLSIWSQKLVWWLELFGAFLVLAFGAILLLANI